MNLEEFRKALSSDATEENAQLSIAADQEVFEELNERYKIMIS